MPPHEGGKLPYVDAPVQRVARALMAFSIGSIRHVELISRPGCIHDTVKCLVRDRCCVYVVASTALLYCTVRYETKVRTHFSIVVNGPGMSGAGLGTGPVVRTGQSQRHHGRFIMLAVAMGVAGWGLWVRCVAQYHVPMTAVVLMTAQNTRSPRRVTMEASVTPVPLVPPCTFITVVLRIISAL